MANIPIYPGSSSFFPGNTPFGFYDNDYQFQIDADKVTTFCARRLGYPLVEVELQDLNFYTAFEEAVTTYGNELYAYKIKQDFLTLEGASTGSNFNNTLITPNFAGVVRISQQYGEEAGVGGKTTWYRGILPLTASVQDYDMSAWATDEKNILIDRLRAYFDETSRQKLMEAKALEIDSTQKSLTQVPMTIFIG